MDRGCRRAAPAGAGSATGGVGGVEAKDEYSPGGQVGRGKSCVDAKLQSLPRPSMRKAVVWFRL